MIDTQKYQALLEAEQTELLSQLGDISRKDPLTGAYLADISKDDATHEADESDLGDRNEEFEESAALTDTLSARLKDVEDALKKIENGNYGICEVSEEPIEEDRLMANPAARTCKAHMNG